MSYGVSKSHYCAPSSPPSAHPKALGPHPISQATFGSSSHFLLEKSLPCEDDLWEPEELPDDPVEEDSPIKYSFM